MSAPRPFCLADRVAAGVTSLAVAGAASPADLAGVVAVDLTTLADAGMVTVGWLTWPILGWRSQPTLLGLSP